MSKKKKEPVIKDYKELRDEIVIDKVNEIFRTQPDNYIAALEEIGFEYNEEDDYDEIEEGNARSENQNQKDLVAFFKGEKKLSDRILHQYLKERDSESPNLPLIRPFFKEANQNLKSLIVYGLEHYPGRIDLLSDLAFFHEFENILRLLITYYTRACVTQSNLETFTELAWDFYYSTNPDGYEALYALKELFDHDTEKRKTIDSLIAETDEGKEADSPKEII
ncbi:MAG: hypothetical protein JRI69_13430 [Deltaproteobacteria bacterium]|nr:hypothetical protein [Deltaproteobacteria bacterium]MBW2089989.1 hypothetical protein [Deltaproteobacteria bacterium]